MLKKSLKNTTSLVLCASLVASPVFAQQGNNGNANGLDVCIGLEPLDSGETFELPDTEGLIAALPCRDLDGNVITDATVLLELLAEAAVAEGEEIDVLDSGAVEGEGAVGGDAATAVDVNDLNTELDETEAEAQADLDLDTDAGPTEEEIQAQLEAEAAAAEAAAAEAAAAEAAAAEAEAAAAAEAEAAAAEAEAAAAAEAEAVAAAEAEAAAAAEAEAAVEETPEVTEGMPEGDDAAVIADTPTTEDQLPPEEPATVVVEDEPEELPAAAAAASDAELDLTATGEAEANVEVEELSEEDVRTSTQDFETTATGTAAVTASEDDDEGLTPFQRALLLGLGAVVVGQVLNNGDEVVSNSGDRVVVERDGELVVLKDDDVLLRQAGSQVQTQSFEDGSTRTIVTRADGDRIVTIRSSDGRVLRRARVLPDGTQIVLFDDTQPRDNQEKVEIPTRTFAAAPSQISDADVDDLREALAAAQAIEYDRTFTLRQVREIVQVRELAPEVELDTITFASGSAAIDPSEARELATLGTVISDIIADDPSQVFLIEGHTDAVGSASYNLALSDRRAETVALALTEYFGVPPENLITQGYGERYLKIQTLEDERLNRRAAVRNITPLLR